MPAGGILAAARAGGGHDTYAKAKAIHKAVEEGVVVPEVIDQLKRGEAVNGGQASRLPAKAAG